jgi:hypothetical protein
MVLHIATADVCERCNQFIRIASISRHPTIPRMAQRSIECTGCGHTSIADLPLGPDRESSVA